MMLQGKVAVITGAGPGLGRTLAVLAAREGADVVVAARGKDGLDAIADAVRREGREALAVPTDVAVPDQVRRLAAATIDRFGRVDVLVNAAFPGTHRKNVLDMDDAYLEQWRAAVETAAYGTLLACRHFAPHMVAAGAGSIVNITSMSSRTGYAGRSDYAAGKAAVHLLSHCLAGELGPAGVRVNCVAPGWIAGDVLDDWMRARAEAEGATFEEVRTRDVAAMALRRIATEEDVARAVLFLASDQARATTGATIDVNGGQLFT
ncbi:SDR family oxidoreductase [Actinomadura macrotermitis]|uniref:3-oxoacyl-[acyl-carrier-protein] reductase FabG n=1 Tax=Actinomadura macrotermitis TaxID=2585200 RepID=A0A7K0BP07_9ACTN|nr:SDR family oxidoreductase [Actinomadura macrotermitis]MQY02929.1 3-oxoacyl-[acyl-carrier-protein] reductase FabG [Actinomadura macrotermitis]